jgi:hypothetical protein
MLDKPNRETVVSVFMKSLRILTTLLFIAAVASAADKDTDKDKNKDQSPSLELTRPVRTWEFLSAVGTRAGIFGNESGRIEAWVYPL